MSRNPNRGRVYRRCACRDTTGKQLGARCPELGQPPARHAGPSPSTYPPSTATARPCAAAASPPRSRPAPRCTRSWPANAPASTSTTARPSPTTSRPGSSSSNASLKPTTLARYRDYVRKDLSPPSARSGSRNSPTTTSPALSATNSPPAAAPSPCTAASRPCPAHSPTPSATTASPHNPARYANIPRPRAGTGPAGHPHKPRPSSATAPRVADPLTELYELIICTGLRKGEALALHWADVDLTTAAVRPLHPLQHQQHHAGVHRTQDQSSHAWIGLSERAVRALRRQAERQRLHRIAAGPRYHDQDLVFTRANGRPLRPEYVLRHLLPAHRRRRPTAHPRARPAPLRRHHHAVLAGPAGDGVQDHAALDPVDHHRGLRPPAPPRRPPGRRRHRHRAHPRRTRPAHATTRDHRPQPPDQVAITASGAEGAVRPHATTRPRQVA